MGFLCLFLLGNVPGPLNTFLWPTPSSVDGLSTRSPPDSLPAYMVIRFLHLLLLFPSYALIFLRSDASILDRSAFCLLQIAASLQFPYDRVFSLAAVLAHSETSLLIRTHVARFSASLWRCFTNLSLSSIPCLPYGEFLTSLVYI